MKITLYELLGMIKNGKAPERILYDNYIWSWTGDDYHTILKNKKEQFLITGMYYTWLTEFLNDEVEILEEEKKIPEKLEYWQGLDKVRNDCELDDLEYAIKYGNYNFEMFFDKINEIIDYLKSKGE